MTIYFIRAGKDGQIKIGYTAGDPLRRMADLQTGCTADLEMIACIEGNSEQERKLHFELRAHRSVGEWFHPHPEVLSAIEARIAQGTPVPVRPKKRKPANEAAEIIEALGGSSAVAELTGASKNSVSNWKSFGRFPANTFTIFRDALAQRGLTAPPSLWRMVGFQ